MLEDKAALGVVGLILFAMLVAFGFMRANDITALFLRKSLDLLRTRTAVVALIFLMLGLLIYGVAQFGLVNSLPQEQHVERNRENNRLIMSEDKDGCLDLRTLGRSNGVYMSLKPCKPADKK